MMVVYTKENGALEITCDMAGVYKYFQMGLVTMVSGLMTKLKFKEGWSMQMVMFILGSGLKVKERFMAF